MKKGFLPKALKQCQITEIWNEKVVVCIFQQLSTKQWNAILNIVSLDRNIGIQGECGRRCSVTLIAISALL